MALRGDEEIFMALFQYKAIGVGGKAEKGVIDADSLVMAKERLRREQVLITDIACLQEDKKKIVLSASQLLAFTREISQLLKAKLPLYESLLTIEEKQRNTKSHPLFVDLCDRLKNGSSFSSALGQYPETFNPIYLSMVVSAEQSSSLFEAFDQLSFLISKQQKLKKQLTSSLAYPAFLGGFCFLVVIALFFFVIPSMKELLEGRALHPLTQAVLFISNFLNANGMVLLFSGIGFLFGVYGATRSQTIRKKVSEKLLSLPFCKKIILESAFVRLFRTMTMLLSGGVPLVEALHFSRKSVGNWLLEDLLSKTEKEIIEGKKISDIFAQSIFIPPLVIRMIKIGEETGNMVSMMQSLAEIYEEELDKNLLQLVTFLQPAVLLFLGGVVGLVVLSILLPLTDVSSFVSS